MLPRPSYVGANVDKQHKSFYEPLVHSVVPIYNPLLHFRKVTLRLCRAELAEACGLSVQIVDLQEKGIPHHLHPKFIKKFPEVTELLPAYYDYRISVRRNNFINPKVVATNGPEFSEFLRSEDITPEQFSELACMPMTDVNFALHHWRLPITIVQFFKEVTK
jgi:hypothetical protein